jgi:mannose/fructose/N-acetylgalactosamine-specific phosphotransferase system component IIC
MLTAIGHALMMSFTMAWEILWALILGFWLSAIVQAVISKDEMSSLLPDNSPRTVLLACGLGTASSFCSYAAVALARSTPCQRAKIRSGLWRALAVGISGVVKMFQMEQLRCEFLRLELQTEESFLQASPIVFIACAVRFAI